MSTAKPPSPQRPLMQTNVKPPSPMLAPEQRPLKPTTPMQAKNAPKTPNSHPQRRCRFQSRLGQRPQRRRRFQSKLGRHPQRRRRFQSKLGRHPQRRCRFQPHTGTITQRRHRFQTTGPAGLQGQAAVPVGGGGARPGFEPTHPATRRYTRHHRCGGHRRDRRAPEGSAAVPVGGGGAWPGFETTRRAKLAARTARGRAAAHRHTQRPGPPAPGTPAGQQATPQRRPQHNETRPRPVSRPRPRRAQSALLSRASASNQAVMST